MRLPRLSSTAPLAQAAIKFERLDQSSKSFFLSIFRPLEPAMWCVRRTDQEPPPVTRRTPQPEVSTGWSWLGPAPPVYLASIHPGCLAFKIPRDSAFLPWYPAKTVAPARFGPAPPQFTLPP